RGLYPKLRIIARSQDAASVEKFRKVGANAVVVEGLTTALDIAQRAILLYEPDEEPIEPETGDESNVAGSTAALVTGVAVEDRQSMEDSPPPSTISSAQSEPEPEADRQIIEVAALNESGKVVTSDDDLSEDLTITKPQEDPVAT
ncbi:MAG: hypothetical protein ACR2QF_11970, partial [Geminicoccaceae bacterium]